MSADLPLFNADIIDVMAVEAYTLLVTVPVGFTPIITLAFIVMLLPVLLSIVSTFSVSLTVMLLDVKASPFTKMS